MTKSVLKPALYCGIKLPDKLWKWAIGLAVAVAVVCLWAFAYLLESYPGDCNDMPSTRHPVLHSAPHAFFNRTARHHQNLAQGWKSNRHKLCPNFVPQLQYQHALFRSAMRELGITQDVEQLKQSRDFWEGYHTEPQGGWVYHDVNGTGNRAAYLRLWKCANNQMQHYANKELSRLGNVTHYSPEHMGETLHSSDCILVVLREPVSHFLSGYNEFDYRVHQNDKPPGSWARWVPGTPERFEAFLADLLTGPENVGWRGKYTMWYEIKHVYPMSSALMEMNKAGVPSGNFVGILLEEVQELVPRVLVDSCGISSQSVTDMPLLGQHETSADPLGTYDAAKAVWKHGGRAARALCSLVAMDYACYDMYFDLPAVCMEVLGKPDLLFIPQGDAP